MSTTTSPSQYAATAPTKDWTRGYARVAGIAYLVTFIASMPAIPLLGPLLNDPSYVLSGGADTQIAVGALLDVVNAVACIVTAVAVFPVVRRQNESLALGFVTSRLMEAAVIMIGVVSLLAVLTLHQDAAGIPAPTPRRCRRRARHSSPSATGHSPSGPTSARASTRCCSARCSASRGSCRGSSPRWASSVHPSFSPPAC